MSDSSETPKVKALLAHADWVRGLAHRLVADADDAEDVQQRAWLAAVRCPPRRLESARGWFARVIRRFATDVRRKAAREPNPISRTPESPDPSSDQIVVEAEAHRELVEAVLALREPYRRTVLLRFFKGLAAVEIARHEGVPSATVRVRLNRGIALLRERLERRHGHRGACIVIASVAGVSSNASSQVARGVLAMTMKKSLAAAVVAAVVVGLVAILNRGGEEQGGSEPAHRLTSETSDSGGAQPEVTTVRTSRFKETLPGEETEDPLGPVDDPAFGALLIKVMWSDGTPAGGVMTHVMYWGQPNPFLHQRAYRTEPDGTATVRRAQPGQVGAYVDRGGGDSGVIEAGKWTTLSCTIPSGPDVAGIVVDHNGAPVPDAQVWMSYVNRQTGGVVTSTDQDGRFHLRSVGRGRTLAARASHHAPSAGQPVVGEVGATQQMTLRLDGVGGAVRGVVTGPTGEPVSDALVQVLLPRTARVTHTGAMPPPIVLRTDSEGGFHAPSVSAGVATVQVRSPGLAPWKGEVRVPLAKTADVAVDLGHAGVVVGIVRLPSGEPAADASIRIGQYAGFLSCMTQTGPDGRFRLTGVAPGQVEISASAKSVGKTKATIEVRENEETRWDVTLDAGLRIHGRVVDAEGQPAVGWLVDVRDKNRGIAGAFWGQSKTDAEGQFNVTNCPDRPLNLEVVERRDGRGVIVAVRKNVRPGGVPLVVRVSPETRPDARLRGRVLEADGQPVKAMILALERDGSRHRKVRTDPKTGSFEMAGVLEGLYEISVRRLSLGRMDLGVRDLRAGQVVDLGDIVLPPAGKLKVEFEGELDVSAAATFMLSQGHAGATWGTRDLDAAELDEPQAVGPGDYVLLVRGARIVTWRGRCTVRSNEVTTLRVRLETGISQRLRFVFPEGVRVSAVGWTLYDEHGERVRNGRAWADNGSPESAVNVPPGQYVLKGQTERGDRCETTFTATSTEPLVEATMTPLWPASGATVRFTFEINGVVASKVVTYYVRSKGRHVGRGTVRREPGGGLTDHGRLPPGTYRVLARAGRGMTGSVEFEIRPNETEKDVRIAVSPGR